MADHALQLLARRDLFPSFDSVQSALGYLTISAININASKYMSFAFFCLLIYDHCTSLILIVDLH